jgi:intracellular sulfur oxidation DsrE/DsrF family protein
MTMKKIIYLLALLTLLSAETALAENINVVLHLNDKAKIPHLERNIANLRKGLGDDVNIQVVINGRAVTSMLNGNRLIEETVKNMLDNKASIGICHYAMQNNNVDQDRLIDGVTILQEGGIVTLVKLQQKGYHYIKL